MSDDTPAAGGSGAPTEIAVGAIVLGAFALLVALRAGFGSLTVKIGG